MDLKEQLTSKRAAVKTALDEAEKLIGEGKFDESLAKSSEAEKFSKEADAIVKAIGAKEADEVSQANAKTTQVERENAKLQVQMHEAQRLSGLAGDGTEGTEGKPAERTPIQQLRFGDLDAATKAIIGDLYGKGFAYDERRANQMDAFVKYLRVGDNRMAANEVSLLDPRKVENYLLRPEMLKSEIVAGRSVGEIKATLLEGELDLGGYLVPEDYRIEIIKRLMGNTVIRKRARVLTTTRDSVEWPVLLGGNTIYTSAVRVTWVEELPSSATAASTNPTFGNLRIPIYTVLARTDMSRNLLEDSAFNMLDVLAGLFSEAMAVDEDNQFLTSQGGGTPIGIMSARGSGSDIQPMIGVAQAVSGNATAITADGFFDMVYAVASQYRNNAAVVASRTTLRDLRKLKDGIGRYLWEESYQAGQPATLLGYPALEDENMPVIAASSFPVLYGDFSGYIVADRVGMTVERITDATLVGQNKVALFARRRLGGAVAEPWKFSALKVSV